VALSCPPRAAINPRTRVVVGGVAGKDQCLVGTSEPPTIGIDKYVR
jgi:hypothetical protein